MTAPPTHVLLLVDNPGDALLVIDSLADGKEEYFSVTQAAGLDEALAHVNQIAFDVIVLDLGVPDGSGLDAMIAMHHHAPFVPIVVLSGVADDQLARKALQGGAQDYIVKGTLGSATLPRTLRHAIDRTAATRGLRESHALLKNFYDSAPLMMGMVEIDSDDIIHLSDNTATATFFGLTPEAMEHRRASALGLPRRYIDEWIGRYAKSLRIGRPVTFEYIHDGPTVRRWLWVTVRPLAEAPHARPRFCYVAQDITQTKETEEQLACSALDMAATNAELAEGRNRAVELARVKSEFLATMSHEIRTPLNGVIGMTSLLLDTHLTAEQHHYATTAKNAGENLLRIINDILDFSKIEAGKLELEVIDFDLRAAVEEVLDLFGEHADRKEVELVGLVYATVPTALRGDPGRLRQILTNLIGNALKFTEHGEIIIQVTREEEGVRRQGATPSGQEQDLAPPSPLHPHDPFPQVSIRFEVSDTGMGISKDAQANLFESFSQAEGSTTRRFGGTGLGLAISKQLVEKMGGAIGVESELGKGSRFWFSVRLEPQPQQRKPTLPSRSNLRGLRVCLVDDRHGNLMLLQEYTKSWGMTSAVAGTGQHALQILAQAAERGEPFDLALLDADMPGMNGFDLAKTIKATPALAKTALVLVASHGKRGDGRAAQAAKISAYLTKPLRQAQLYQCLAQVMGKPSETPVAVSSPPSPFITTHSLAEAALRAKAKILLAEDNILNQTVAVSMLGKLGYSSEIVSNGQEAVAATSTSQYDLVFMDCHMPVMDGFEATEAIRTREVVDLKNTEPVPHSADSTSTPSSHPSRLTAHHLPIIALTASALASDRERCIAVGMDDFLPKPMTMKSLASVLDRWRPGMTRHAHLPPTTGHSVRTDPLAFLSSDPTRSIVPTDSPAVVQGALCDMTTSLERLEGDEALFLKLVDLFLVQGPTSLSELQEALDQGDAAEGARVSHRLRGSVAQFGAPSLTETLQQIERFCKAGHVPAAQTFCPSVELDMSRLLESLRTIKAKLQPS